MPHVIVKLAAGRSGQQKARITRDITKAIMAGANVPEDAVSVNIEDVPAGDWTELVFKPDIRGKWDTLTKKPGYTPSDLND